MDLSVCVWLSVCGFMKSLYQYRFLGCCCCISWLWIPAVLRHGGAIIAGKQVSDVMLHKMLTACYSGRHGMAGANAANCLALPRWPQNWITPSRSRWSHFNNIFPITAVILLWYSLDNVVWRLSCWLTTCWSFYWSSQLLKQHVHTSREISGRMMTQLRFNLLNIYCPWLIHLPEPSGYTLLKKLFDRFWWPPWWILETLTLDRHLCHDLACDSSVQKRMSAF